MFSILDQNVLRFEFPYIMLPDSNVNEPASHGYVMFRIQQKPGLQIGDKIRNNAAIYFDGNAPVITNTTEHTLGLELFSYIVSTPDRPEVSLQVFPNPAVESALFSLKGARKGADLRIELYDNQGRALAAAAFGDAGYTLDCRSLPTGLYLFHIFENGLPLVAGKLAVQAH